MKYSKWFEITLIIVVMGIHAYAAVSEAHNFPNDWFTRDDAYYYFKVAQNISEGRGVTFDGINLTNGYHPLWMLICIPIFALARFDLILPLRVLLLVMAALNVATGILIYRLVSKTLSQLVGVLTAAYWCFNIYIHGTVTQFGLETGIAAFALMLLLYRLGDFEQKWRAQPVTIRQMVGLGALAVLVLFSRLDTVFLVTLVGLWLVFRSTPMRYYLLLDATAIAIAALLSFILRTGLPDYYQYSSPALWMLLIGLPVKILAFYFLGLYQPPGTLPFIQLLKRTGLAATAGTALASAVMLVLGAASLFDGFPRSALILDWGLTLFLVTGIRLLVQIKSTPSGQQPADVLIQLRQNWKRWLAEGSAYFGVMGGALGIYMLYNKLAFGTASPVSGQIKRWWGSLPSRVYGGPVRTLGDYFGLLPGKEYSTWELATAPIQELNETVAGWFRQYDHDTGYWALFFLLASLTLMIFMTDRRRATRASVHLGLVPLFAGSVLQILSYNALGYASMKGWYWVSEMLFAILAGGLILDLLLRKIRRWPVTRYATWIIASLLSLNMALGFGRIIYYRMPLDTGKAGQPYMDVLTVLESNTEPGALIGMTGGGNVGYFINGRTITNVDGLINSPAYFEAMQRGEAAQYLQAMGLDYIFANPDLLEQMPYRGQFTGRLEPIASYGRKSLMRFLPQSVASP